MSQAGKAKGRRFQKEVRQNILDAFPRLHEGDVDWASMGSGGEDIILSPQARELLPVSIETKYGNRPPWKSGMDQAEENAGEYIPVYIRRKPHEDAYAVLPWLDLLELLKSAARVSDVDTEKVNKIIQLAKSL